VICNYLRFPFIQKQLTNAQENLILKRVSLRLPKAVGNTCLSKGLDPIRLYGGHDLSI
jgi:hypothetical protein